ncbi:hypothetical protein F310043J5_00780 [Anaerostipes hominis (ex Lee et al. 2021)]
MTVQEELSYGTKKYPEYVCLYSGYSNDLFLTTTHNSTKDLKFLSSVPLHELDIQDDILY